MKKTITLVLAIVMLLCAPISAHASVPSKGTYGDLSYTFSKTGVLTFSGNGDMAGASPFADEVAIKSVIVGKGGLSVASYAFQDCVGITDITLNTVEKIGDYAFSGCKNLEDVAIPSVKTINHYSFANCASVKSLYIPLTLKTVCDYAFVGCTSLKTVYYAGSKSDWSKINIENTDKSNAPLLAANIVYDFKSDGCEHEIIKVITPATLKSDGLYEEYCKYCKGDYYQEDIYRPAKFELPKTKYVYTGKAIKPAVTVTDTEGMKIPASNYSVKYENNVKIGKAKVTIKFNGKRYKGTKAIYFSIIPKSPAKIKIAESRKKYTLSWSKISGASGYKLQYSTSSSFKNAKTLTLKGSDKTSKAFLKTKFKKKVYVRVRSFKTVDGTDFNGKWSKTKTIE